MINSGDKGISVGEKTKATIENNVIYGSVYGIAVKDLSEALIKKNTLVDNGTGLALYRKKKFLGGGSAKVSYNLIWLNDKQVEIDQYSKAEVSNNSIQGKFDDANIELAPQFKTEGKYKYIIDKEDFIYGARVQND